MKTEQTDHARLTIEEFQQMFFGLQSEVEKVFIGQKEVLQGVLSALMCNGHVLLEGVPGLGKTFLVHSMSKAIDASFSRIQFTPDLMPADITGSMVLRETAGKSPEVQFQEGPIVANFVLADEINRATPKTQSALLQAMQERQISVMRRTIDLPKPFIVLATQNPVEHEGTYPLPEAQLDRFLVKLLISYPQEQDYHQILSQTTGSESSQVRRICDEETILNMQQTVGQVVVSRQVQAYAIRLLMATQPNSPYAPEQVNQFIALGASPRGVQGLIMMAKVRALLDGRPAVSCKDIREVAPAVLRHRIMLNFEGQSGRITPDQLVSHILEFLREVA